jgi:hypothetical protein
MCQARVLYSTYCGKLSERRTVCGLSESFQLCSLQNFRYANMDYSICQALGFYKASSSATVIYDIACQWSKNFASRVKTTPTLKLPQDFKITPAVGKFHLGAHINSCFALHSLNFIKGAGQIDGEVIETLWAILNEVAGSTRTMGWAFRQETIDKHMNDSNWQKTVAIGKPHVQSYVSQLII